MKPSEILTSQPIEPKWIVRDMIPCGTLIILAGAPGAGKSSLMYSLTYAVAAGRPFLGLQTTRTRVAYFDEENALPDFLQYHQWAWGGVGTPDPLTLDPWIDCFHFEMGTHWQQAMTHCVQACHPGLIIIDTASSVFHLLDENDNSEATRIIRFLRHLRSSAGPDTSIIVLKHEKQRSDTGHRRTIRGAKVWLGSFDQVLYHVIPRGGKRRHDGTRKTLLVPDKVRAFALKAPIGIDPTLMAPHALVLVPYPVAPEGGEEGSGE